MRTLWVNPFPVFGGPHNTVLTLNSSLKAAGVESTFLLPTEPGTAAERLRNGGVDVALLPLHRLRRTLDPRPHTALISNAARDVGRIRGVMKRGRYDVVVLMGLTNPHGATAARLERLPIVWQLLDSATPPALRAALMPLVRRWSDVVMFNGYALERLHCGGHALRQPTAIFTAPVDTERFRPRTLAQRARLRAKLGIPADAPVVGTVANVNPMKGIEWFIRAAIRVYAERPDAWFLICGEQYRTHEPYTRMLEREMRASPVGAERWIIVRGPPDAYYPVLDVKLITSIPRSEGRSTTGPEAMASGIPVVATDVGAVREVVEDQRTGLLVPPLDADALARATLILLADEEMRLRLGAEGRRLAVERYGIAPSARVHLDALAAARRHHAGRSSVT